MRKTEGFTLLELVIVMTLMVIMLGLSGAQFANLLPSVRLNSAGRELSGLIRMARVEAMSSGEERKVTIDLDGRRYGFSGGAVRTLPEDVGVRVLDPLSGETTRGTYHIAADPLGSVRSCKVVLWNSKKSLTITVDPVMGSMVLKGARDGP